VAIEAAPRDRVLAHSWRIGLARRCPRSVASKVECAGVESDSARNQMHWLGYPL